MTDFLLELRSEEIPARMQDKARDDLARLFAAELDRAGLKAAEIITYATPRRLALIARGLPLETQAVSEETKGPKVGAPPQAMEGFLRKVGLTQEQLVERDGVYFAVVEKPGRATSDVLAQAIPAIVRAFPWPKSQRWGAASISTESLRWVRPLQGMVALFGQDVVPCEVDGILSGYQTLGHRFHHPGEITIGSAGDYVEKLRACHVIVDQEERRAIIRAGAEKAAAEAGLTLVPDEGLVNENGGLTEWPVPMLGRFDPAFLEVPEEVIQLTARVNQKYFVCHDKSGKLANAFVCTANIVANDGGAAIVAGNEKVLAARLSDAKFFWEQDLKVPLQSQANKLSQITFHEKLGTVADKVERVAKLARWLVTERIVAPAQAGAHHASQSKPMGEIGSSLRWSDGEVEALAVQAERAARLCKADLVTGMVGEFPELQGVMGGYYARAQGEPDAVADAVRDHYKPVGQGDDVPTAPVTVAVSLADKLDTIAGFFLIGQEPTGSKDPFALRRAAIASGNLATTSQLRLPMVITFANAFLGYVETAYNWSQRAAAGVNQQAASLNRWTELREFATEQGIFHGLPSQPKIETIEFQAAKDLLLAVKFESTGVMIQRVQQIVTFMFDRLKVQQREAGVRHDLIDAVFALGGEDDLVRLLARVKALQGFVGTDEGKNLLAGYKRAANILKSSPLAGRGTAEGGGGGSPPEAVLDVQSPLHHPADGPPPRAGEELPPVLDRNGAPMSSSDEQQIPQTGEEDPFVEVDQGLRRAIAGNEGRTEGTVPEGAAAADIALLGALDLAQPQAAKAVEEERFEDAMAALASLRAPIDRFFDEVMVNDEDPAKRAFRLGLLARFRNAVHRVADFSRIEG